MNYKGVHRTLEWVTDTRHLCSGCVPSQFCTRCSFKLNGCTGYTKNTIVDKLYSFYCKHVTNRHGQQMQHIRHGLGSKTKSAGTNRACICSEIRNRCGGWETGKRLSFVACVCFAVMEKKLRWISSRKHNPAVKCFYGNPAHTNPRTQCYSGSKCKTHLTCTFSSYNSNYQFNYLLNPLANQQLPEELLELHPMLALGVLLHVWHTLCCPLKLGSTLSSILHLFLAPHGFW